MTGNDQEVNITMIAHVPGPNNTEIPVNITIPITTDVRKLLPFDGRQSPVGRGKVIVHHGEPVSRIFKKKKPELEPIPEKHEEVNEPEVKTLPVEPLKDEGKAAPETVEGAPAPATEGAHATST